MGTIVIYIAPALTDQAGQCRIYRARFDGSVNADGIKTHYRNHPDRYTEVGLMNSRGGLVCFEGTEEQFADLLNSQPLAAGLVFRYENTTETQ